MTNFARLQANEDFRADLLIAAERELGRRSLHDFARLAWHVVEPGVPFTDGWHLKAVCDHLQAVSSGTIRNLVINMPPRHTKSGLVGVMWPAWEWIDHPEVSWLTGSYSHPLAVRDALKMRRLIESRWYRERWGSSFKLKPDQNAKTRFDNDKGGYRIPTSVDGAALGEGGDRIVADDPNNLKKIHSEAERNSAVEWWDGIMEMRGNNPKTVAKVIVQQRGHEGDVTGHVLKKAPGQWVHLRLPAERDGDPCRTPIFEDTRALGELLWPERFGPAELDAAKQALGSYGAAAQLQQRPMPEGGGTFKIEWFGRYRTMPAMGKKVVSVDCANKAKELNDYSVAGFFREHAERAHLGDVWRERVEYPGLKRGVINFCEKHHPDEVLIEDKGNGTPLIQDLRQSTRLPIIAIEPEGDKVMRAQRTSPSVEAGLVLLPEQSPWLLDFEHEIGHFPNADFDDQVDMLTQFLDRFARGTVPGFAAAGSRSMTGVSRT